MAKTKTSKCDVGKSKVSVKSIVAMFNDYVTELSDLECTEDELLCRVIGWTDAFSFVFQRDDIREALDKEIDLLAVQLDLIEEDSEESDEKDESKLN
jgi:hypothetical protein